MAILTPHKTPGGRPSQRRLTSTGRPGLPLKVFPGRWWSKSKGWKQKAIVIGAAFVLVGIITAVGVVAWVSQDLPDPNKINARVVAQSTKIYARDGSTLLYEIHGDQRRTLVDLKDTGKYTKQAVLSIEDKDFYKHPGISIRGIFRALFIDITSGSRAQGGSTITQQLVKNAILTNEKSIIRKVKEVILAYQLERRFSKDQILRLYFNEIPWGSSADGAEAAAQTYFGKSAKDLDLAESSLLAAMVQRPSYFSPRGNHREELVGRQKFVLDRMVEDKYITKAQAQEAKAVDILARVTATRDRVVAPHFVFTVKDLLIQKYGEVEVERGGLKVITTLDPRLQKIAEEEVKNGVEANEKRYNATNAALVAADPKTGQVLAMVGSRDYFDTEHDGNYNVATALRNPGSSFKPIVYLSAFTKGYTPDTVLFDLKTSFGPDGSGKDFSPNNYDLREHGPLKMRQTLAGSLNIPAVKTLYLAGIPSTIDLANKLGYTTIDRSKVGLALAIGGGAVRLVEHVSAFGVIANDGAKNPTTYILKIQDRNGKTLEQYQKKEEQVIDQQYVRELSDVMTDNNARAFVFGSRSPLILPNRIVAAKTGTTNDFRDAWTMGFTPSLVAGVWRGNNDNSSMKSGSDGVIVAAPIWNAFMRRALENTPAEKFTKPKANTAKKPVLRGQLASEVPIEVDSVTGKQIPDSCLATWPKNYVSEKLVKEVHSILYYVTKDDPNGPAPSNPKSDPMFERWEKPIQAWAKKNNLIAKAPAMEDCSLRTSGNGPTVTFSEPTNNKTVKSDSVKVTVAVASAQSITSVTFAIDGQVVATEVDSPYTTTLNLEGVSNGFHSITATATDALGATGSANVSINVLSDSSATTLYFISPKPKTDIKTDAFPKSVRVFAYDSQGVANITLSMKNPDGSLIVLDTIDLPDNDTVTLSWPTTSPGSYQLFFTVRGKKGRVTQSDYLPVTVSSS